MAAVVALIALQSVDHAFNLATNAHQIAIAVSLIALAPIRIASASRTIGADATAIFAIGIHRILLRCHELAPRCLKIGNRAFAMAAIIAPIVLQLIDRAIEAAMHLREILIACAIPDREGRCRGAESDGERQCAQAMKAIHKDVSFPFPN